MKDFIFWLAKVFDVDITVEKIIYKDKIKEVIKEVVIEKLVAFDSAAEGNVTVKGDLIVKGFLRVEGEVSCFKVKED